MKLKLCTQWVLIPFAVVSCLMCLSSCKNTPTDGKLEKDANFNKKLVINEVMCRNYTGILTKQGDLYDWIEIKNLSNSDIALQDYSLMLTKPQKAKKDSVTAKKDSVTSKKDSVKSKKDSVKSKKNSEKTKKDSASDDKDNTWQFPEMKLKAGGTVIVYASKNGKVSKDELCADFNIPAKGGCLQLIKGSKILSEVKLGKMNSDQSYCRQDDGSYEKSYLQTPGFENDTTGFENYNSLISQQRRSPLLISEMMTRESKQENNWIELKNTGTTAINLSGYCLTNDPEKMDKWQFPNEELKPGGCCIVYSKGRVVKGTKRTMANFKFNKGESVLLTKDGKFVDGICVKTAPIGTSVGRTKTGNGFYFFSAPSKGTANAAKGYRYVTASPEFIKKPGLYAKSKTVTVLINGHGAKVHYTLDGSEPIATSPVFKDSLVLDSTTTVRCYAEGSENALPSRVATGTYFINEPHSIAVMNISIASDILFDPTTGMYMPGPTPGRAWPHKSANYWKNIEKRANIEFYDGKTSFSTTCGLKIFGGFSRAEDKKSFYLKFRQFYDSENLCFDIFKQGKDVEVKKLVLRSGSQDYYGVMVRDEFFTSLMAKTNPNLLVQAYRPVALYINAKYFGLYYIREKVDDDFVARHLNVSNDSISIMFSMYLEQGSRVTYDQALNYVKSHDMKTKADYDYVGSLIDFESLIDQKLGEIYSGNTDVGNVRIVRSDDPKGDRKWHWVFFDLDATWRGNMPAADHLLPDHGVTVHNALIGNMLKNPDFRKLFLERLSLHMHKTFTPQNATAVFDNLIKTIQPEMPLNCKRWPKLSYKTWQTHVTDFRSKFANRNKIVLNDIRSCLSITPAENKQYFGDLGF